MWKLSPVLSLWLVEQREMELTRDAERYRLSSALPDRPTARFSARLLSGTRRRIERLNAFAGRALSSREAPCNDPCPDAASG